LIPTVIIVGADKGGVGKTTVTRVLLDYLHINNIKHRAFDTEVPNGSLKRFAPALTDVVDLTRSDDQMKVFDTLPASDVTVIDVRAGLLSPTLKTLSAIGFIDAAKNGTLKIIVLHILGPATTSLDEIAPTIKALEGCRHIPVANHINDTAFVVPTGSLDIPKLEERASQAVDASAQSFADFGASAPSLVMRGYVNNWLNQVFDQFNIARLNKL
jgi:MinD-like ATPase involved in chromosome partitioning or flagellar assembly